MREKILKNSAVSCMLIFALLLAVHCAEALWLRTDESFFGENFINKLFGVAALWLVLRILGWKWRSIGFGKEHFLRCVCVGTALAALVFFTAYLAEILILGGRGQSVRLGVFTTGFSLDGEAAVHTGAGYILMCVLFNIINVIMEEGTFRGLFLSLFRLERGEKAAVLLQALLFGLWHIVTPLRPLIDGSMEAGTFTVLGAGYILLAGLMGIKWGLLYKVTGSLYAGMADHFFNNCIATNLLHVVTDSGTDEMQIVRVALAQLLSFIIVYAVYCKKEKSGKIRI